MIDTRNYYIEKSKIFNDILNNTFQLRIIDIQSTWNFQDNYLYNKTKLDLLKKYSLQDYENDKDNNELIITKNVNFHDIYTYIFEYVNEKINSEKTNTHYISYWEFWSDFIFSLKKPDENVLFHDLYTKFMYKEEDKINTLIKWADVILQEFLEKLIEEDTKKWKNSIFVFVWNSIFEFLFKTHSSNYSCLCSSNEKELLYKFNIWKLPWKKIIHQENFQYSLSLSTFFKENWELNLENTNSIFEDISENLKINKISKIIGIENYWDINEDNIKKTFDFMWILNIFNFY